MKLISEHELANLLRAVAKLRVLEHGGVRHWEWYDASFEDAEIEEPSYSDYIEQTDEQMTEGYADAEDNTNKSK